MRRAKAIFGGPGPGGGFALIDTMNIKVPTALISPPELTKESARSDQTLGKRQSYLRLGAVLEVPEAERAAVTIAGLVLSDRLAMDLRYYLMTAMREAATKNRSFEMAQRAQKVASEVLQTNINYRDIRAQMEAIRSLTDELRPGSG